MYILHIAASRRTGKRTGLNANAVVTCSDKTILDRYVFTPNDINSVTCNQAGQNVDVANGNIPACTGDKVPNAAVYNSDALDADIIAQGKGCHQASPIFVWFMPYRAV